MSIARPILSRLRAALSRATALAVVAAFLTANAAQYDQRLLNLSTRGLVGTGDNIMITGFVIQEGAPKRMLIRAVGPRLGTSPHNVPGALSDPVLSLYNSAGVLVNSNDNWASADAATFTSVGAFALNNGSRDSAIVATLAPGVYTAQVRGANGGTGVSLLEVYDVTGSARLVNLSTRALVGSGANTLISGLVIGAGGGARRVLIRAVGPTLRPMGVADALPDPVFSVIDSAGRTVAGNDNWDADPVLGAALVAAAAQSGAFPLPSGTRDAALVADLLPGTYTVLVSSVAPGVVGTALVEAYDLTPDRIPTVSVAATVPSTDTNGAAPGLVTFTRLGPVNAAIDVRYAITGTAVAGADFVPLSGTVNIPAGASTATVTVSPLVNGENINNRTATLTLVADPSYGVGAIDTASVTIFYNPGSLLVSNLRPAPAAGSSTAYGTATLQLSPDETHAFVNVSFSNLSSPEVVAHLAIDGNYIFTLPNGQVSGAFWTFTASGTYSVADIVAAIKAGRVYVSIDTAQHPTGELTGFFVRSSGSAAFNPPPAPPSVDLTTVTEQDAARFLSQATFGTSTPEIAAVRQKGYATWINEQIALPPSLHRVAAVADFTQFSQPTGSTAVSGTNRQAAWWKLSVTAPDQLRQRMAFALSELFVVSDANTILSEQPEPLANYYDMLVRGAFGNYRELLEQVTLHPLMGVYLNSLRNGRGTFDAQGRVLTSADENYAREVMQLFTIGLRQLQPDGTLLLDPTGQPIPTYDQATISETAKVFTGWAFHSTAASPSFRGGAADYYNPMMLYPAQHDVTEKTIVGGRVLPAGQGGIQDLEDTLDALFNHPNTGPFVSRQLIQRLVTSNPSPAYVYRVAQVFANNGAGVRGDLGAVVRAILLDYEARSPALLGISGHGKLREPLLRATAMFRAFNGGSNSGRFNSGTPETALAQAALRSPTVFNFFEPDYVVPGALAAAGLFAPEYQILTDSTAITIPNFLHAYLYANRSATDMTQQLIGLDLSALTPVARTNPMQMIEQVNLRLCNGTMTQWMKDRILAALNGLTSNITETERARIAIYLALTSPEGAVQK